MANRYWVGGTGTWDTTTTTNWSASSGGGSGASVPTVADNVFFDQAGTYTVTMTGALACLDITVSAGTVTFATGTAPTLNVRGSMSLLAGTVWSSTGNLTFTSTSTGRTITTNGVAIAPLAFITFNGVGGGWTLGSALGVSTSTLIFTAGTFDTSSSGNYSVTCDQFSSNNSNIRTISLNASTVNIGSGTAGAFNASTSTNLTFNAGTSQINLTAGTGGINSGGLAFYNVAFTSTTAGTRPVTGINTFNNLTVTGPASAGVTTVTFAANQTINGTLSTTGTAGNQRVFFASATYGIGFTLTVNSAASLTDADFRDLYVKGTAAPISGTRIGNRGNCTGITFSTPKTVYWNQVAGGSWSDNAWATSSGGSVSTDNCPLPQDTATFVNTGLNTSASVATSSINSYLSSVDMSARTNAMTFNLSGTTQTCYGNWTNGSGTTIFGTQTLTFSGGATQTITSAGKTFSCPITVDTYGGTVQLADALTLAANILLFITNGTFTTAGFAVTADSFRANNSNVRTISFGASTLTFTVNGGNAVDVNTTNLTFNSGTSQINFSGSVGGGVSNTGLTALALYNFSITSTAATDTLVTGLFSFNNFTVTAPASAGISQARFGANATINGTLTCAGASAVRRISIRSDTIGTQRTLTAAAISATDCDFSDIILAGAAAGASPTRAGDCGNNSGITFPASKTVYWNLAGTQNWSATAWCTGSGGTPAVNNFPLAQDTAVFDNTGSAGTVQTNAAWNIGTFDASGRTSAMTFSSSTLSPVVYGDWKFGTGVTVSSTTGVITFSKNGTQTITSNGVQFGCPVTINHPNAYVQLADALSLNSARTLTLTGGTFDAVTYNVTTGLFTNSASTNTLKMGSGTWTISGIGTVWAMNSQPTLIVGTSTIVLSDTSVTGRIFNAGTDSYYNKITIGGSTGTSTTAISFNSSLTLGELASTKTVAHTITFTSLTTTIGKWSVTGTVGNVVTVTSSVAGTAFTLSIAGPANSGIDYLSVQDCTVSTTSPGEFYVGANSTNVSNNTRVIFTATPTPRNLYWVGGTGNWSSTTKWATSSGGVSGADIPMSLDTVTFDSLSNATAYTATIDAGVTIARCAAFTMAGPLTGNVTWAGTVPIAFHGNVSFAATGITRSYTGAINWAGNSSYTITTNGLSLGNTLTINGIGSTWTLGSALTSSGNGISLLYGTFSTSAFNYAVSTSAFSSTGFGVRSVNFFGSILSFSLSSASSFNTGTATTSANLTFNAGTSEIILSGKPAGIVSPNLTFYNVFFSNTSANANTVTGINTFNNLKIEGAASIGLQTTTFSANQTISGTLTINAGPVATDRNFLLSNVFGTTRTLTVNAFAAGSADVDFRDITIAGAAAPISGTRFGDCKGNSGITFPAAKTVYYGQTGSTNWGFSGSGSWSATSGGALDATQFPLAQDTAVFPAATYPASGSVTTVNANFNIGTIDMSLRTSNTMTLATGTTTPQIYGNWINGTGTTLSGTGVMTFAGRGSQTITSAGKTFTQGFTFSSPGGSVTLQDAFICSSANTVFSFGTFNANNYNVSLTSSTSTVATSNSNSRTIAVGSGTWTLAGATAWSATTSTNLTVTGTGTLSLTNGSAKSFQGGSFSYSGITLNQGGLGTLAITGNNTFANITKTAVGATTINFGTSSTTVVAFTAAGTASNLLTITGTSSASPATLIYTGGGVISTVDYVVPSAVRAYPTTSTWYAGANSTNGGTLGWVFAAYVPPSSGQNSNFLVFFN